MFECKTIDSIHLISAQEWDELWPSEYPFTKHAFFAALEDSGSIDGLNTNPQKQTGWQTKHLVVSNQGRTVAVMPLFLKDHSYGEYVFDWSWANAYHQNGLAYYPKLLNAIPFTPATGPRLGVDASFENTSSRTQIYNSIFSFVSELCDKNSYSGFHSLFPFGDQDVSWRHVGLSQRIGCQFHWFNQDYSNFDDFLDRFSSRKRKNLKKERAKAAEANLEIHMREGKHIKPEEWDQFYHLYQMTYLKRSGHGGYLGKKFFHQVADGLPNNVVLASAHQKNEMIAAALYFRDDDTLYGRYWGCVQELDALHFECCYYQGIEYAIKHKLQRFDPGAQGEHKIQRGFTPIKTHSFHWLTHPAFNNAIKNFVSEEAAELETYIHTARDSLPFREGSNIISEEILVNQ
ncbi:MAG: GNAT family N-acetyltransferase [Agarilytica sp.]